MKTFEDFLNKVAAERGHGSWAALKWMDYGKHAERIVLMEAAEAYAQHRYEEGLKADRQIDRDQLNILFHNYFDCYTDDGDDGVPAMTFSRFVEAVEKIMKSPPLPAEQETKNQ